MIGIWQISEKLRIKWNFELTVFELTVPDLYYWKDATLLKRKFQAQAVQKL